MTILRRLGRWVGAHLQALGVSFLLVVFAAAVFWFFASFVPDRREAAIEGWRREFSLRADHERDLIERRILDVTEDLRFFAALPSVRGLLAPGPSEGPAGTEAAHLQGILSDFRHLLHQRSVSTLDASGRVRASDGDPAPGAAALALAADVIRSGAPEIALVREPDGVTSLVRAMPVTGDEAGTGRLPILGAVLAVGDASTLLFDLLGQPVAASSSEALLVREDVTDVLFLSPLRFRPDPPLSFRLPLASAGLAAGASLSGKDDFRAFVDYRGAKVFAAVRRLANTPWGLVVKVDEDEALAAFRKDMLQEGITWGALLVALFAAAASLWRWSAVRSALERQRFILERRRGDEALRESEERYRHIVEAATEGICTLDAEVRITFANGAFARMLGYTPEEMLGTPVERYTFPEEFDEHRARMDARRRGVAERYERCLRRKDGKECWCLVSGAPILESDGRFAGSFGMFTDITDRRRLEEQLRQSQKMEAVGRLAGGVAHDFNNLLTVILGYSDVLLQGLEPGPLLEATQEVRRAGEQAAALTRQLLAFSRKQTLVPEILDMGDVVSGLSTMVVRLIGEDVKVSVVVSPGLGRVKADRGQLEQVVMNLAVNARDAMPKGGNLLFELQNVELDDAYAATHAEVKAGPYVLLAISDTGTGMDAETQKRVFEPFFTTKETGKGTGLGLSTVYGIVHQSGGAIDVYSEPGQGTTFKVYLPRFAGDAAVRRPVSGDHPALRAGSETVLVVEDEAAIRQLTKLILQKAGYTVLLAESPVAAERIAGSHPGPIHLMLTDVVMPGMRGPELAERLIRLRPDLGVLYMSGYTDNAIAHHGLLDAGTEFLQKPFTPLRLTQKIREVLSRER